MNFAAERNGPEVLKRIPKMVPRYEPLRAEKVMQMRILSREEAASHLPTENSSLDPDVQTEKNWERIIEACQQEEAGKTGAVSEVMQQVRADRADLERRVAASRDSSTTQPSGTSTAASAQ